MWTLLDRIGSLRTIPTRRITEKAVFRYHSEGISEVMAELVTRWTTFAD